MLKRRGEGSARPRRARTQAREGRRWNGHLRRSSRWRHVASLVRCERNVLRVLPMANVRLFCTSNETGGYRSTPRAVPFVVRIEVERSSRVTCTVGRGTESPARRFVPFPRVQREPVRSLGHRWRRVAPSRWFVGKRTTWISYATSSTCRRTVRSSSWCVFSYFGRVPNVLHGFTGIPRASWIRLCIPFASRRRSIACIAVVPSLAWAVRSRSPPVVSFPSHSSHGALTTRDGFEAMGSGPGPLGGSSDEDLPVPTGKL